jgi:hypothetical protein
VIFLFFDKDSGLLFVGLSIIADLFVFPLLEGTFFIRFSRSLIIIIGSFSFIAVATEFGHMSELVACGA